MGKARSGPQAKELRYFLTQFVVKHFSRIRSTVQREYPDSLFFLEPAVAEATIGLMLLLSAFQNFALGALVTTGAKWVFWIFCVLLLAGGVITLISPQNTFAALADILGFIFFLRDIPAVFFLGFYFFFQLWQAGFQFLYPPEGGGVAVFAHVGGFLAGLAAGFLYRGRVRLRPAY